MGEPRISKAWSNLIQAATANEHWDFANQQLYELCARHPLHDVSAVNIAKIWLIGRSYAAAIERKRRNAALGDRFYETKVGPTIALAPIDTWLREIAKFERISLESQRPILEVHKKVMRLFSRISGRGNRSLASKYLHFHLPKHFFIYDSRAVSGMRMLAGTVGATHQTPYRQSDALYSSFVRRCVLLQDRIHRISGVALSPRQLDNLLLEVSCMINRPGPLC